MCAPDLNIPPPGGRHFHIWLSGPTRTLISPSAVRSERDAVLIFHPNHTAPILARIFLNSKNYKFTSSTCVVAVWWFKKKKKFTEFKFNFQVKCKAPELDQSGEVVIRIRPTADRRWNLLDIEFQPERCRRTASNKLLDFFGVLITAMIRRRFVPPSAPVHVTAPVGLISRWKWRH